jgi:hypothetical protein
VTVTAARDSARRARLWARFQSSFSRDSRAALRARYLRWVSAADFGFGFPARSKSGVDLGLFLFGAPTALILGRGLRHG